MKKLLFAAASLCLFSGCWILPSGDPPEGNILTNQPKDNKKFASPAEAFDYMVTSVTAALLEKCPGENVNISGVKGNNIRVVHSVLRESGRISGNIFTAQNSDWQIVSSDKNNALDIALIYKGKKVWEETVALP